MCCRDDVGSPGRTWSRVAVFTSRPGWLRRDPAVHEVAVVIQLDNDGDAP